MTATLSHPQITQWELPTAAAARPRAHKARPTFCPGSERSPRPPALRLGSGVPLSPWDDFALVRPSKSRSEPHLPGGSLSLQTFSLWLRTAADLDFLMTRDSSLCLKINYAHVLYPSNKPKVSQ